MAPQRRPFQGVLNILSFNRHFYVIGLVVLAAIVGIHIYFPMPSWLFLTILCAFAYGLIMPLIVSAYVYDYSGYYKFDWLEQIVADQHETGKIVNINAGFDETSFILADRFPNSSIEVFDFYDQHRHTEPAIVRARKVSLVYPGTKQMDSGRVPLNDHSVDKIFLLSAVHEIRANQEKVRFLTECRRVCKPDGQVIMVEHLRDLPNFLAFTIGFTHFFSRHTWLSAFRSAGFSTVSETKFTPFLSIFVARY